MRVPRIVWLGLGHTCVVVGVVGVALPVMPGAPFLILAAICYARGSRRFFIRLVRHKRAGPSIRRWLRHRTIPLRAKLVAVGGMGVGAGVSAFAIPLWQGQLGMACVVGLAATYVLTRPSHAPAP